MLAYDVRDDYEIIEGVNFMAPGPDLGHINVSVNLIGELNTYVKSNKLGFICNDNTDIYLPDGNLFRPDFAFISSANVKLSMDYKKKRFYGVPDMVAEIFSRSTMKRDLGVKKDVYERNGVKEYWMIDPWRETIDVYLLRDGKYELDGHYENWSDDELAELPEDERAEVKLEVPVAVLDGFKIKIRNIFGWYFE